MDPTAATRLLTPAARHRRSSTIRELLTLADRPGMRSLAGGLPAADALATPLVAAALGRALDPHGPYGPVALQYGPTEGWGPLRELVRTRVAALTGRSTDDVEAVVTTGSQQGLSLLGEALLGPGDTLVVAAPTYLGALSALGGPGVRIKAVASDRDGLRVDDLARRLRYGLRPKAVYVVPDFDNPTGAVLSVERRRALAQLADRYGFLVIEDDPYRDLRFRGEPLPPVAAFGEHVVRLESASKVIAPGLRVGWMSAPSALGPVLDAVVRGKQAADLHTSSLSQVVVADVLGDAWGLDSHLTTVRAVSRARAAALARGLRAEAGDLLTWTDPDGGMFLWVALAGDALAGPTAITTDELLGRALDAGVAFVPGSAFYAADADGIDGMSAGSRALRCSFASLVEAELAEAGACLAAVLKAEVRRPAGAGRSTGSTDRPGVDAGAGSGNDAESGNDAGSEHATGAGTTDTVETDVASGPGALGRSDVVPILDVIEREVILDRGEDTAVVAAGPAEARDGRAVTGRRADRSTVSATSAPAISGAATPSATIVAATRRSTSARAG